MYHEHNLAEVQVALFSPFYVSPDIRNAIQSTGIKRINALDLVELFHCAVDETNFDIIILEAEEQVKPTSKHVCDIRQGRYGDNPYVVVNVATWKPKDEAIRTYVDFGVDDILIMPALFDAVATRVDNIVDNRKKFIATKNIWARIAATRIALNRMN